MRLIPGQKAPLASLGLGQQIAIEVDHGTADVDVVLFGLDRDKRIGDDSYTVLHSQTRSPEGALSMRTGHLTTGFDVDLSRLPSHVDRLMLVASRDGGPLRAGLPLAVTIGTASFDLAGVLADERAAMLVEIYRHGGDWRLAAVGQGFAQGLARLIEHLGGSVVGEAPISRASHAPAPAAAPTPPSGPISLTKITLEKRQSISLEKTGGAFSDIVLNLNWRNRRRALDLDLGCLYELQDGTQGIIQALGGAFGSLNAPPFIELDGDDRSGSNTAGETIRIKGVNFDRIRRIGVFALIYEGAFRWSETDARISVNIPGQPEVEVNIRDGDDRDRLYGMAVVENQRGAMHISNHARCYRDQKEYAEALGIHLRWKVGHKD